MWAAEEGSYHRLCLGHTHTNEAKALEHLEHR